MYTGDTSYAIDNATSNLMDRYLILEQWYKVVSICNYAQSGEMHYILGNWGIAYPCKSFIKDYRRYIKNKYDLK